MILKLFYQNKDLGLEILSDRFMMVDDFINHVKFDMEQYAKLQGWGNWDFDDLKVKAFHKNGKEIK